MKLRAEKDPGSTWNRAVKPTAGSVDRFVTARRDSTDDLDSASSAVEQKQEASGPYHSVLVEERVWTANWINQYITIYVQFEKKMFHLSLSLLDFLLMMLI